MSILSRHITLNYLKLFFGTLGVLTLIFLVVEFVDRSRDYTGDNWQYWVTILYANKALSVGYLLAPAAMLLAAGLTVSAMNRRGEFIAIRALAIGPWRVLRPLAICGAFLCLSLIAAGEYIVGPAEIRVDEINAQHFRRAGTWRLFYGDKAWLRGKRHFYHLRGGSPDEGFKNVTIYDIDREFHLNQRIDAELMENPEGGHEWTLSNGAVRDYAGDGSLTYTPFEKKMITLEEDAKSFRIRKGYPEQMRFSQLREQIALREQVGLVTERYKLALHNKVAAPFSGFPGLLLMFALATLSGRKSRMSSTLAEGFFIIVLQWGLLVVFKATAFAGFLPPAAASWTPDILLALLAAVALRKCVR